MRALCIRGAPSRGLHGGTVYTVVEQWLTCRCPIQTPDGTAMPGPHLLFEIEEVELDPEMARSLVMLRALGPCMDCGWPWPRPARAVFLATRFIPLGGEPAEAADDRRREPADRAVSSA